MRHTTPAYGPSNGMDVPSPLKSAPQSPNVANSLANAEIALDLANTLVEEIHNLLGGTNGAKDGSCSPDSNGMEARADRINCKAQDVRAKLEGLASRLFGN